MLSQFDHFVLYFLWFSIIIKLPTQLGMNKEYPSKSMTQSFLKNPTYQPNSPPTNHQSYYYSRPTTNYISYSPDRMNNSFVAPSSSFNPLPARLEHLPSKNL